MLGNLGGFGYVIGVVLRELWRDEVGVVFVGVGGKE